MLICYTQHRFRARALAIIEKANEIIAAYEGQGFTLTLRQLYYQFVSRSILSNSQNSYDRLGDIVSKARKAGLMSWKAIEDRTRWVRCHNHWDSPQSILDSAIRTYAIDRWANQKWRPEVWIEKDALIGVIQGVCEELDVPYFSCRGFGSDSELWQAGQRFQKYLDDDQMPQVIHLGDHDPSGIDMTRDNAERLLLFAGFSVPVLRIALNYDQVEEYNPPPNPAKETDSRARGYIEKYGSSSWELDALEPSVIAALVREKIDSLRDEGLWNEAEAQEQAGRKKLEELRGFI